MRSWTRSDVKWLINEAAALAGELARMEEEVARLELRRVTVEKAHHAYVRTLGVVAGPLSDLPLPTVRAHRNYGGRGKLRQFLRDTVKGVAPDELDSNELSFLAIDCFELTFSSPDELYRFKNNTIGRALRHLEQEGVVVPVGVQYAGPSGVGRWRWKAALPTLEELATQVRDIGAETTCAMEGGMWH